MSRRSRVRQVVLQLLYQDDLNPGDAGQWRQFLNQRLLGKQDLIHLGERWFLGVRQHRGAIDEKIVATARNWKLNRMPPLDRNIVRLAAYEFLFGDTPYQVAINEAVELAKRFGTKDSPRFVNGVLDRIREDNSNPNARPHLSESTNTDVAAKQP
ncbi:MAG: transcription antitermination factor NusB [Pirellulaceae bacterium]